jgi:hypothetical protein
MAQLTVKDFTGGQTDFPISADSNRFEKADNLVINQYGDLESRPGLLYDFTTTGIRARVPSKLRIGLLVPQYTGTGKTFTLLKQSSTKLFYDNATTRTELVGPGSASAFDITNMSETVACSYSDWNEHTFLTHEEPWQIPMKVYRDSGGVLRLRTAGLPPVAGSGITVTGGSGTSFIYAFAYKYSYTVGSTTYEDVGRPFLKEFTSLSADPSATPHAVGSIPVLASASGEHYDTANIKVQIYRTTGAGSILYYVGEVTNGTTTFNDNVTDATLLAANNTIYTTGGVLENDRPPQCKYVHSTSDLTYWAHGYEVSTTGANGDFLPQRVWQSKRGDPDSVPAAFFTDIEEPITAIASIKSIPIVFGENSVYRLDGSFDTLGRGGLFPRKISDRVGCVGHLSVVQTLDGLYFAGTDGFYFTDGYQIYSLSAEDFKESYSQLILTQLQKKRIYGTYDAINKRILWSVHDPSRDTETENNVIFCMYVPARKFSRWHSGYEGSGPFFSGAATVGGGGTTLTVGSTAGIEVGDWVHIAGFENQGLHVLSLTSTVITLSAATSATGSVNIEVFNNEVTQADIYGQFQPSAVLFTNSTVWQGDGRGFTLKYNNDTLYDVIVDTRIDPTSASAVTPVKRSILFNYAGAVLDLGTTEYRKWVNSLLVKARPRVDVSAQTAIQPYSENDDNDLLQEMRVIFSTSFYRWGTPEISYGDPRLWRRRQQIVDETRRFPKNNLRCEYKQVHFRAGFVNILNSDSYGEITSKIYTAGTNTSAIVIPTSWSNDLYNSWLYPEGSTVGYKILSTTGTTAIVLGDYSGTTTNKWVVKAYPVDNYLNLIEYTLYYEVLGATQSSYRTAPGGNVIT